MGTCEAISIAEKIEKRIILSISGPWDLLQSIPRAISDRMVQVPFIFMSSRVILGRSKAPCVSARFLRVKCHHIFYHSRFGNHGHRIQNMPGPGMPNPPPGFLHLVFLARTWDAQAPLGAIWGWLGIRGRGIGIQGGSGPRP